MVCLQKGVKVKRDVEQLGLFKGIKEVMFEG